MILLYTLVLLLLGVAAFLARRRSRGLERKYYRIATEADRLAQNPQLRQGNSSRTDPYQAAKRQFELGLLVQKRDRLEGKFDYWQGLSKRLTAVLAGVRAWNGRKLPYAFGVLDVSLALYLIDELTGGRYLSVKPLVEAVTSLLVR